MCMSLKDPPPEKKVNVYFFMTFRVHGNEVPICESHLLNKIPLCYFVKLGVLYHDTII